MAITIVTKAGKGQPLTSAEIDANFTNLRDGIEALDGLGIASAEATPAGDMTLVLTNGDRVGPIRLPTKTIRPRGLWTAGVAYVVGDTVRIDGSTYYVASDHVAAAASGTDIGAGRLVLFAQKGGDGAGLAEAPQNGQPHVRQDGNWTPMPIPAAAADQAPKDGKIRGVKDGAWVEVSAGGSGGGSGGGMLKWIGPYDDKPFQQRVRQFDVVAHRGTWWVAIVDHDDPMVPGSRIVEPGLPGLGETEIDDGLWAMLTFPLISAGPATDAIMHQKPDQTVAKLGNVINDLLARIAVLEARP